MIRLDRLPTDEPKAGSAPVEKACCEECKRFHRHFRTDCCKCRTSFGPTDIPEAPVDKAGETVIDAKTGIFWRFEGADHPDVTCSGKEAFCSFCELATKVIALRAELAAIKAQASDATEYVLAVENRELRAEVERMKKFEKLERHALLTNASLRSALEEKDKLIAALRADIAARKWNDQ